MASSITRQLWARLKPERFFEAGFPLAFGVRVLLVGKSGGLAPGAGGKFSPFGEGERVSGSPVGAWLAAEGIEGAVSPGF
jgi:hypothetical protein